mmetsp:Transcript_48678/g.139144  ORF Transcript_48678/g.139144 Transcript_48678/m.139144 type:complete len:265 (+) Transcript_48678:302-1096(+)
MLECPCVHQPDLTRAPARPPDAGLAVRVQEREGHRSGGQRLEIRRRRGAARQEDHLGTCLLKVAVVHLAVVLDARTHHVAVLRLIKMAGAAHEAGRIVPFARLANIAYDLQEADWRIQVPTNKLGHLTGKGIDGQRKSVAQRLAIHRPPGVQRFQRRVLLSAKVGKVAGRPLLLQHCQSCGCQCTLCTLVLDTHILIQCAADTLIIQTFPCHQIDKGNERCSNSNGACRHCTDPCSCSLVQLGKLGQQALVVKDNILQGSGIHT